VGIEASGQSQWFERMLAELGHEVWIGDAAKIRASGERKQKTDRRDAELLMKLLAEDRFPRIRVTHPGVGPVTALAFTLTMGPAERFPRGKQIASYLGLIPSEIPAAGASSGSDTAANRAIRFCAGCWWKRRRVRCGMSRRCLAPINDWPSGSEPERLFGKCAADRSYRTSRLLGLEQLGHRPDCRGVDTVCRTGFYFASS
jgi:transposase